MVETRDVDVIEHERPGPAGQRFLVRFMVPSGRVMHAWYEPKNDDEAVWISQRFDGHERLAVLIEDERVASLVQQTRQ